MWAISIVGAILLLHSIYSSWELSEIAKVAGVPHILPKDVAIEAIIGLVVVSASSVWTAYKALRPESLAEEYAQLNKQGENPYAHLENRPTFQDIMARRQVFHNWKAKSDPRVDPERDPAMEEYIEKNGKKPPITKVKKRSKA